MQKTKVYYSDVSNLDISKYYDLLPKHRKNKVDFLANLKDKRLSIGVWILLVRALKNNNVDINKYDFLVLDNGKPILKDCPMHISYSHSGDMVMVALSNSPVGVDIQKEANITENIKKYILNQNDEEFFNNSLNKNIALNKIWVLKEALGKVDGNINFKNIIIDYKNARVSKIKDYYFAVAPFNDFITEEIIF